MLAHNDHVAVPYNPDLDKGRGREREGEEERIYSIVNGDSILFFGWPQKLMVVRTGRGTDSCCEM